MSQSLCIRAKGLTVIAPTLFKQEYILFRDKQSINSILVSDDDDDVYFLAPVSLPPSRLSPRPSQSVVATFHQRSGRRGLSVKYRGYQCTSMALAAIIVSKTLPLQNWRTPDLDAILRYGDLLHADLLHLRGKRQNDPRLALHEIPTGENNKYTVPVADRNEKWFTRDYPIRQFLTLSKSEDYYGLVHPGNTSHQQHHKDLGYTIIEDAIDIVLNQDFDGVLITVGDVSGSVFKDNAGKIKYFDSHSNNKWGRLSIDGTAVLLTFDTICDFVRLIRKREPRISYRYELIGLKVHVIKTQKNSSDPNGNSEEVVEMSEGSTYDLPKHTAPSGATGDLKARVENTADHIADRTDNTLDSLSTGDKIDSFMDSFAIGTGDCAEDIAVGTENTADGMGNIPGETKDVVDLMEHKADDTVYIACESEKIAEAESTANGVQNIQGETEEIAGRIEDTTGQTVDLVCETSGIAEFEGQTNGTEDIPGEAENMVDRFEDPINDPVCITGENEKIEETGDTTNGYEDMLSETEETAHRIGDITDETVHLPGKNEDGTVNTVDGIEDFLGETEETADGIGDTTNYIVHIPEKTEDGTVNTAESIEHVLSKTQEIAGRKEDTARDFVDIACEAEDIENIEDIPHKAADIADYIVYIAGQTEEITEKENTVDDIVDIPSENEDAADRSEDRTNDIEDIAGETDNIAKTEDTADGIEATAYCTEISDIVEISVDITEDEEAKADYIESLTTSIEDIAENNDDKTDDIENNTCSTEDVLDNAWDSTHYIEDATGKTGNKDVTWEIIHGIDDISDKRPVDFGRILENDDNDDVDINIDITENGDIVTNVNEQILEGSEDATTVTNLDNGGVNTKEGFFEITSDSMDVTEVIRLSD